MGRPPLYRRPTNEEIPLTGDGYVYLVTFSAGVCKIGYTRSPLRRMLTIQGQIGQPYTDLHLIPVRRMPGWCERGLHQTYADYRVEGEWFNLSEEQITEIKSINGFGMYRTYPT